MTLKFTIPYRYGFFIGINCVLSISTYFFFYNVSDGVLKHLPYFFHIITELVISLLMILRGEKVHVMKLIVIGTTTTFTILLTAFLLARICCSTSNGLLATIFVGYIIFRCIYILTLFQLDKKLCKEYDKIQMHEQRMAEKDLQPSARPFMVPTISGGFLKPSSVQASAATVPPKTLLGFDAIETHDGYKKTTEYGWAV